MDASFPRLVRALLIVVSFARPAAAQAPLAPVPPLPPPPPPWTGSAGAGLSLNRGNSSTTSINLSFDASRDSRAGSVWKIKGLYQRGDNNGVRAVDRLLFDGRHEYTLSSRTYGFAQLQFLEDHFKAIDFLWAPAAGIGVKLLADGRTTLHVDAGLGVKIERSLPSDDEPVVVRREPTRIDGDVTLSNKLEHRISKDSTVTQGFNVLWRATDFGDALYTFTAAVTAAVTTRTQLKMELLDTYSTRPPDVHVQGNDAALLTAFVYKF